MQSDHNESYNQKPSKVNQNEFSNHFQSSNVEIKVELCTSISNSFQL